MRRTILLNPGPVTTSKGVKKALIVEDICHREATFISVLHDIRHKLLQLAGADNRFSSVLFASSGTGAIEACISSLVPHNKAIAIINNGVYGQRMIDIAMRYRMKVVELKYAADELLPLPDIERTISDNTDIAYVAMVHHETSSGVLNPLQAVGDICFRQERGLILDAMSSFAGADIDVVRDHIDFLISSSNKCIQGMPGLSFVIGKKDQIIASDKESRSYYFDLCKEFQSLENTGQMRFTVPVQITYSLQQALDELITETIPKRIARYHDNYDHLVQGLTSLGFKVLTPVAMASKLLCCVAFPKDVVIDGFTKLHASLFSQGITIYPATCGSSNMFRIACIGDLTHQDITYALKQISVSLKL